MADVETLNYRGTFEIKEGFENILRDIFANSAIIKDDTFRYVSGNEKASKIRIYRSYPTRVEHWPIIYITVGPHNPKLTALGVNKEEEGELIEGGILKTQSATGHAIVPVNLNIQCKEMQGARDRLRDLLVQILRVLGRQQFVLYGLGWSDIEASGDDQTEDADGKIIYQATVTVYVNTDYTEVLGINSEAVGLIESIVVDVLGRDTPGGSLRELHKEPPFPP